MTSEALPKRVLHVIPAISPVYGGPSQAVRTMARVASDAGIEVDIATTTADGDGELPATPGGPAWEPAREDGARVFYFPRQRPRAWTFSWPLTRFLQRRIGDYDLVHVHALFSYPTLPACRLAARAGVPYLLRPLGQLDPWSLAQKGWKKRPYFACVERTHLERASLVHVTSDSEKRFLEHLGHGERAALIPNAVEIPASLERPPAERGVLRMLSLARLHPKKGLEDAIEAVARLRAEGVDVDFTIAGDGPANYRAKLEHEVESRRLEDRIDFVGRVCGTAKATLLQSSDLFVLPSYQENFGIALAEAMAYGLPAVVSSDVALAEAVHRADAGAIVRAGRPAELARAIQTFTDRSVRTEAGRRARTLAEESFSIERMRTALLEAYARVLDESENAPRTRTRDEAEERAAAA